MTARPDPHPRPSVVRDGLAVYAIGDGEPVLLMPGPHRFQRPGLPSADALIDGLVGLGRRVVTFDPPGSGSSTRPARLGMAEMYACADEALEALSPGALSPGTDAEGVDVVGHSMAGLVALAYALERPDRVRRLVLIGTGSGGPAYLRSPGALWNRGHPGFPGMAALGVLHVLVPCRATETLLTRYIAARSYVDRGLAPAPPLHAGDWLRPRRGRATWHRVARRLDYAPRLARVAAPTLVLCGDHDPQFPPAASRELADRIPDAELVTFARSGHFPYLEEPDAFWTAVGTFLDGVRRAGPGGAPELLR